MDSTQSSKIVLLYVTTPSKEEAVQLSQALLKKKLIACANILPQMTSLYHWQGQMETSQECVLLLKTKESYSSKIEVYLREHHSYETPCVLEIPVQRVSPGYLSWLCQELDEKKILSSRPKKEE